jgi:hypothetical protein
MVEAREHVCAGWTGEARIGTPYFGTSPNSLLL